MSKSNKSTIGVVIAALAGFVAGVLLAPKSGKETREDLKKGSKKVVSAAEEKLNAIYEELSKHVETLEEKISSAGSRAKEETKDALRSANKAKMQVKEVLVSIKNKQSTDDDLNEAIENAKKALASVKNYIKK